MTRATPPTRLVGEILTYDPNRQTGVIQLRVGATAGHQTYTFSAGDVTGAITVGAPIVFTVDPEAPQFYYSLPHPPGARPRHHDSHRRRRFSTGPPRSRTGSASSSP